ncbi:hypothetical protein EXT47_10065 [Pseudoalteromonas sp. CO342X]|nr:hypothetical protein EXT47_10065 [Pseudoalteromonas sp. CO342X]
MLKISHLEQLNSKVFVWLSTRFSRLKINHLIKRIGITHTELSSIKLLFQKNTTICFILKI